MLLKKILTILAITLLFGQTACANKQSLENAKKTLNTRMGETLQKYNSNKAMKLGIKGILYQKRHTKLSQEIEDSLEEYFVSEMGFNVFNRSALIIKVTKKEAKNQISNFYFDNTPDEQLGRFASVNVLISGTLEKIGDDLKIKIVALDIETLQNIAIESVNTGFSDNEGRLNKESDTHTQLHENNEKGNGIKKNKGTIGSYREAKLKAEAELKAERRRNREAEQRRRNREEEREEEREEKREEKEEQRRNREAEQQRQRQLQQQQRQSQQPASSCCNLHTRAVVCRMSVPGPRGVPCSCFGVGGGITCY